MLTKDGLNLKEKNGALVNCDLWTSLVFNLLYFILFVGTGLGNEATSVLSGLHKSILMPKLKN